MRNVLTCGGRSCIRFNACILIIKWLYLSARPTFLPTLISYHCGVQLLRSKNSINCAVSNILHCSTDGEGQFIKIGLTRQVRKLFSKSYISLNNRFSSSEPALLRPWANAKVKIDLGSRQLTRFIRFHAANSSLCLIELRTWKNERKSWKPMIKPKLLTN